MKYHAGCLVAGFASLAFTANMPPPTAVAASFDLTGSIQIQAQRAFWENGSNNNLDELWGRINVGAKAKAENFSGEINIRAFPEGFGYEALTGLTVRDSTDTISLTTTKTNIGKFLVEQGWVKYSSTLLDFKIGRYFTSTSKSIANGNYIDQDAGVAYMGKLAYHNASEFILKTGMLQSSVMLGINDSKLNTGYLRIWESVAPTKELNVGAGYRSNVFDLPYNENARLIHRIGITGDYLIKKDLKPYVEAGIIIRSKPTSPSTATDTVLIPVVIGTSIPTAGILTTLAVEVEIDKDRKVSGTERPVTFAILLSKKIGPYVNLQAALLSDNASKNASDMRLALRFTSALK